ncbi:MAG TPA: DNA primase [Blastocatellia bacterium]|nr:DNA primase [Blastocatellia bacterium]
MRFPRQFAEDVKNQSDIVRVVSDYLTLKKRGGSYWACCPFHSEKSPSFHVHPGKGIFKCFGCGTGGGVFDFVMQIEGCSYQEAVRIVADKSGVPIPQFSESESHGRSAQEREVILRLNDWAAQFFESQLGSAGEGERARDYVRTRGINDETRQRFKIGYAPDRWDLLIKHLTERGATSDEIALSGLVVVKEDGKYYDRFRGRVIFPITDTQNRVIAFGGRVMGEGEPKYLNSPESALYTKGRNLYGLAHSKDPIRKSGFAVIVEGYLDCIIPFQEGIHNVVASLGTALTEHQVRLLRRYMDMPHIIVNFDPDSAGQAATLRSIEILLAEGFKVNVLRLPTNQDPDEFVRANGAASFRELFRSTQPYIEYVVDQALAANDITRPSGKVEAINSVLPHLVRMRDKVERADYAAQLADRFKVDSRIIREEIKRAASERRLSLDAARIRTARDVTKAEHQLLEVILGKPEVRKAIVPNLYEEDFAELATAPIFSAVIKLESEGLDPDYDRLSERAEGVDRSLLTDLLISDLGWANSDDFENLFKKATEALTTIRARRLENQMETIQREIAEAHRNGDVDTERRLNMEKLEIGRRMHRLARSG